MCCDFPSNYCLCKCMKTVLCGIPVSLLSCVSQQRFKCEYVSIHIFFSSFQDYFLTFLSSFLFPSVPSLPFPSHLCPFLSSSLISTCPSLPSLLPLLSSSSVSSLVLSSLLPSFFVFPSFLSSFLLFSFPPSSSNPSFSFRLYSPNFPLMGIPK